MAPLFSMLDGARDVETLGEALADTLGVERGHRADVARYTRAVVSGLRERGLVVPA
jgi:hypothetical protein